jgi:RNA polymerase sigma factor (sigma-70 family)
MTDRAANPDTVELFARYRQGDQQAATALFERYLLRLTALARARLAAKLSARVDPEDVIQSAYRSFFIGAREGRFSIEQSGDLWRLLVTITLRKLYRQAARYTADVRDIGRERRISPDAEWTEQVIARDPTPDEVVAVADELESLLSSLPAASRRIVELRMQGESLEEIARVVNRSERTVRRALKEIQDDYVKRYGPVAGEGSPHPRRWASGRRARRIRAAPPAPLERPTVSSADAPVRYSDFVLKELIGAGGMGKVYRAVPRGADQPVALKFLRKQFLSRSDAVAAFVLLLAGDRSVRVTDFGLARNLPGNGTTTTAIAGSAAYMAPEQIADCWGPLTYATDLYGLGAVLYHLLTGRPPFAGERAVDVLAQVVSHQTPPTQQHLNPSIPSALSQFCLQCLSKRAADRPQSMSELMAALPSAAPWCRQLADR